jgi:uncharacterized tellurite resistance protein B-like protein
MEIVLSILGFFAIGIIWHVVSASGKAVIDTARGQGTLWENLGANFEGLPETEFRVVNDVLTLESGAPLDIFRFEMKGVIPVGRGTNISVGISLLDDETKMPVLCLLDDFQELTSRCFLSKRELGHVPPDSGYKSWVTVGLAIKDTLIPPKSGNRRLITLFRFMHPEAEIYGGRLDGDSPYLYNQYSTLTSSDGSAIWLNFDGVGYVDADENSEIAQTLALKLAVSLAMVDGELHESEGFAIKNWIQKYVEDFEGSRREQVKSTMNGTLEGAYREATTTGIDREPLLLELAEVGTKIDHYEALELLMDIMAADDEAHASELAFVNHVGSALGISIQEIQRMKDLRLIDNDQMVITENNAEQVLGIDPDTMSRAEICQKLEQEFLTWNSRIQSLDTLEERETAQNMLNLISQAQIKYCG